MKLFEITITAYKVFYVEAESQEAALEHEVVDEEANFSFGEVKWETDETRAGEVSEAISAQIKLRYPKQILK